jgi:hypothetical protein
MNENGWSRLSDNYLSAAAGGANFGQRPCSLLPTMLPTSRVSWSLVTRRTILRKPHLTPVLSTAKRAYVQPSGADRASVVDIPSAYQDESHFAPRAGIRHLF